MNLAGTWQFALDRDDKGLAERWHERRLDGEITLPGSLPAQGIGDPVSVDTPWTGQLKPEWFESERYAPYRETGNVKTSFWLQPETVYVGAVWYQREIDIPQEWAGKRVTLTLERPHIETTAWLDDVCLGTENSLGTAHVYALGPAATPGAHRLTLRIDNRLPIKVGVNSHSVSDHTQGNWNGAVGAITLAATSKTWIADVRVHGHASTRSAAVTAQIASETGMAGEGTIRFHAHGDDASFSPVDVPVTWEGTGGSVSVDYALGESARLWDEFDPVVYQLDAELIVGGVVTDTRTTTFGLRDVGIDGTQITINGRKTFLRGTLECCIFPRTGYPPTDVAEWSRIFGIAKAHGLNMLRFHSWCPPKAAFNAADAQGVYLQVECSSWANHPDAAIGVGDPLDAWLYREAARMLADYGNHPSFVLLLYGNEPTGNMAEFLGPWINHLKALDPRRLYSGGAGWPEIPENECHVTPDPRIYHWGEGLDSRINKYPPSTTADYSDFISARTAPVIVHETGQWCAFPNFGEMEKYTGHLKPRNFEIFQDFLAQAGLADQAKDFLFASGKLQALCYKEEIEATLRTPGMAGFQLLDLHDFPGQGTALVGVLDAFWDSKGYISADEYRRFCDSTVLLARLDRRVFTNSDRLTASVEVAHFGPAALVDVVPYWRLVNALGQTLREGTLPVRNIRIGNGTLLGEISVPLRDLRTPQQLKLVIGLTSTRFENDWDVWVYPDEVESAVPARVLVTDRLDEEAEQALAAGGCVVWSVPREAVRPPDAGPVALGFSSIFWNTAWTDSQPPDTLGILCDPEHPLLREFPTEGYSNWQWWYIIQRATPLALNGLPLALRPTVQVIDDWHKSRRLGLVVEANVGQGRLIVTGIDILSDFAGDPVTRQFRHSLLRYCARGEFGPAEAMTVEQARTFAVEI